MAQERQLEAKRALKQQRAQLDHLNTLRKQLEVEQEEGKRQLLRRQVRCTASLCALPVQRWLWLFSSADSA
jgi:hypothetical protein